MRASKESAWCVCARSPCGRMRVWVSSSALSPAGCVTSNGSHRWGMGWCVGGMCHPHHSQVVSAVEALDFRRLWWCSSAGYICLPVLLSKDMKHSALCRPHEQHTSSKTCHINNAKEALMLKQETWSYLAWCLSLQQMRLWGRLALYFNGACKKEETLEKIDHITVLDCDVSLTPLRLLVGREELRTRWRNLTNSSTVLQQVN